MAKENDIVFHKASQGVCLLKVHILLTVLCEGSKMIN